MVTTPRREMLKFGPGDKRKLDTGVSTINIYIFVISIFLEQKLYPISYSSGCITFF